MEHTTRIFIIATLLLIWITGIAGQERKNAFANIRAEHAETLRSWLKAKPNLRPATEADCRNKTSLKLQRSDDKGYQPYYLAADLDGDTQTDFAVALVDNKKRAAVKFVLAIFNYTDRGYRQALIQPDLDLHQSGLFLWGAERNQLAVGEFQTDNCGYYKWTGDKYVAIDCTDAEN
ncbi:MAG: hypothetical protein WKF34_02965 [Pyrinomonadaceae bacterium]